MIIKWLDRFAIHGLDRHFSFRLAQRGMQFCMLVTLGGDPAADSPTATLLRLNPPCKAQIRTPP